MFAAARARTKERRADGCFSARMGRSRWDRPGTPSLPLGRCVVLTGPAGGGDRVRPHVRRGEDVGRARAQERRADGCFSARMGRSRWHRPGTPSLPLGRCVVRTGGSARAAAPRVLADIAGAWAKKQLVGRCILARMVRSRWDRPGTPSLPLGRCVVRTGPAGGGDRVRPHVRRGAGVHEGTPRGWVFLGADG